MNRDEAFREYEEALSLVGEQTKVATEEAKSILHERLDAIRTAHHEELKAIRAMQQKTR